MKLCILCNFGPFPEVGGSVGGSEAVISALALGLIKNYGYTVSIYGYNYKKVSKYNDIGIYPCPKGNELISQINQNDHVLTYSDSFWGMDTLLQNIEKIVPRLSLPLVGAYHLRSHPQSFKLLKENIDKFNLITHSKGPDYDFAVKNGLKVSIIPNGISLSEFSSNNIDFKNKYNIKEKYIILNAASFFFGKGQEILPKICKKLLERIDDFVILQLSNTIEYPYDKRFFNRAAQQSRGLNIRFMRDLPREDVVAAFLASDVFILTSLKEVSPIVILECRAAELPWVALTVGDLLQQSGGIAMTLSGGLDKKGYAIITDRDICHFSTCLEHFLTGNQPIEKEQGQIEIEGKDWKNIVPLYHEVFSK
ncbi:MAG: glycosyltransferase family 4 protein [Candidatus Asgardarchaeia archaeon]